MSSSTPWSLSVHLIGTRVAFNIREFRHSQISDFSMLTRSEYTLCYRRFACILTDTDERLAGWLAFPSCRTFTDYPSRKPGAQIAVADLRYRFLDTHTKPPVRLESGVDVSWNYEWRLAHEKIDPIKSGWTSQIRLVYVEHKYAPRNRCSDVDCRRENRVARRMNRLEGIQAI